ncbi:methyltransferase type 11, partial [Streptomyces sp. NPDC006129]
RGPGRSRGGRAQQRAGRAGGRPAAGAVPSAPVNVFAPRNGPEFHRVLRPDGALLVVTPTGRHLRELHEPLGLLGVDARKEERLRRTLSAAFRPDRAEPLEYAMTLTAEDVTSLVAMTPTAHHLGPEELRRRVAESGTPVRVTASFLVSVYRPRRSGQ